MRLLRIIGNKFLLTTAAFVVWMLFFDQNDFFSQREKKHDLQDARDNITYLNGEISKMELDYNRLLSDPKKLEEVAREKYHMKRDNEDLYVIEKK